MGSWMMALLLWCCPYCQRVSSYLLLLVVVVLVVMLCKCVRCGACVSWCRDRKEGVGASRCLENSGEVDRAAGASKQHAKKTCPANEMHTERNYFVALYHQFYFTCARAWSVSHFKNTKYRRSIFFNVHGSSRLLPPSLPPSPLSLRKLQIQLNEIHQPIRQESAQPTQKPQRHPVDIRD